ncbi:acetylornithine aminotransferase [Moorella thermoacetica]|uniref:Acetylornithine aminotransferase n=1 Tax=Moorella thermoacetica (strain ATCC 39073 / JCM 9320) TaxID=264732 RepID=Q2RG65_MOOTA|nr:acetylornithine transaminase [Moorella thermoacetica]AKX95140.1 acetylornithine aminotransferase [Moorella thermoacetica]AKX97765.1 acetylornithine aminotransferase [Moorella thermoacetica]OIQ56596.1 acetylornithine aminotransferase [Moorella thermoacetica]QDA01585.1 Acetylornithine aminotransferase [Moorella thermoacetica]TYL09401.1 Acetylornithine aminotransferase [Moorella thermoacetica]
MDNAAIVSRGEKYVMRTYGRYPMALVRGEGARVWDADGKEYLDFVSGLAVNSLGHCHPRVVEAIREQAGRLIHCSNLYWIEPQVELARLLVENSALDKVFFCNSGAEANEAAIKLARKYAKEHRGPESYEIITMRRSFHGRTLATLTATGQEKFHHGFAPLPPGFRYAPFNDLSSLRAAVGPRTCAVMLEPVQGEGGVYAANKDYLQAVRALCDDEGLLLIFDEVQCGLGRTGYLFAYQYYEVEPDILTLAKALAGGVPIGAMLAKERAASAFAPGDHASTFGGNPLATAAGVAAFKALLQEGLVENARVLGQYFYQQLEGLVREFPQLIEVRGRGLLLGVEIDGPAGEVVAACQERGLLINSLHGHVLRFLPPLIVTREDIDRAVTILKEALHEVLGQGQK